jgi:hypothetical protein
MDLDIIPELFFPQKFVPLVGLFFYRLFILQENKCKMLELIPHDLERNWCEMMSSPAN